MWPSSNSSTPGQWSFNPAIYQNIPYEQIDWASLAQQWIKMKETVPKANPSPGPPPPPAPLLSKMNESVSTTKISESIPENLTAAKEQSVNDIEGGEAPMDMDTKDDEAAISPVSVNSGTNWNQWNNWQSQWGWGWSGNAGTVPLGEKTPSTTSTIDSKVKSLSNDSIPVLNNLISNVGNLPTTGSSGGTSTSQVAGSFNYNNISGEMIPPVLPKSSYWNDNSYSGPGKSSWSKGNKLLGRHANKIAAEQYPVLDVAKKKQLPAWIREGLNKMEREKQKQLEKERILQVNPKFEDLYQDQSSENHVPVEAIRNEIQNSIMEKDVDEPLSSSQYPPRSSPSPERSSYHERIPSVFVDTKPLRKTKEQIMEESMLKVRRILTQFLLEATESYVQAIAREELKRKKPALVQQLRNSNALASLTANLGLNVYDSDSQSSDSDRENDNDRNSDEELQILIEKKKRDFTLIEDQIEKEIENQELQEREMNQQDNENNDEEDEDNRNGNHIVVRGNVSYNDNDDLVRSRDGTYCTVSKIEASEYVENQIETNSNKSNSLNFTTKVVKVDRVNAEVEKSRRSTDLKKRARSSSLSTSSSSSSSSSSSKSRDSSLESGSSSSSSYSKKKPRGETRQREESKRYRYRSRSRSMSRSRYRRSSRRYRSSPSREDVERRKSSNHRKSSCNHRRSPSYHRDSRESSSSKYKSSRRYDSGDSWRKRRRSNSRESRHSHYRRH